MGQGTTDTNVHEDMTNCPLVHEKGTATLKHKPPLALPAESNSTHLSRSLITYQVLIDKTSLRCGKIKLVMTEVFSGAMYQVPVT